MTRCVSVALLGVAHLVACQTVPGTAAPATPQRPTLSSDTSTTPLGRLEVEFGIVRDDRVGFDSPVTFKYGSGERTEVTVGWSPLRRVDLGAGRENGPGDLVVGLRHRLRDTGLEGLSGAFQALVKLPTAEDPELGTGEVDAQFAAIGSGALGPVGATGYYALGVLGDPAGGSAVSHSFAFAGGLPLEEGLSAFGELAAVLVPEQDAESLFTTLGLAYSPDPSLVLDAALVLGLSSEAADWQLLLGLTKNFGQIARRTGR